jgi:peptidoglycan/LPS O-acetylase OafA/YrhL
MAGEKRIPSLDGIRAFLLLIVVTSHLTGTPNFPITKLSSVVLTDLAFRAFFVISGYLITGILLNDYEKRGKISLGKFYFRRVLRLFPAFYAYVAVVLALHHWTGLPLKDGDVLHAVTYTMNYHRDRAWSLGASWSLSVEEQFYLLWPLVLVFLRPRWGQALAAIFVLAGPALRLGSWFLFPASREGIGETFPTIADSIAVGCLLTRGRKWLDENDAYARFRASPFFIIVPLLMVAFTQTGHYPKAHMVVGQTAMNIGIALCIDWCIRYPDGVVGRFINRRPFVLIGTWSYSMYLWQQLFCNRTSDWWMCAFPQNLIFTAIAGVISFYVVEQPSLRAREWLEPKLFKRPAPAPVPGA